MEVFFALINRRQRRSILFSTARDYGNTQIHFRQNDVSQAILHYDQSGQAFGINVSSMSTTNFAIAKSTGYVGIGDNLAPQERLHVGGKVRIDESGASFLQLNSTGLGNVTMQFTQQGTQRYRLGFDNSTNDFVIATDDVGLRPDFIINRVNGFVGLGTKTPGARLQLQDGDLEITNSGDNFFLRTNASGQLDFVPNNAVSAAAMTIDDDNSFVGIGVTSPAYKLEVNGDIKCGGDFITNATDGVLNVGGAMNPIVNVIGDADNHVIVNGDEDLYVQDDLEIGSIAYKPGGGSWSTTSDARLKKDIKPYTDGLETIMKINPVWFKYNEKMPVNYQDKDYIGVIAQDMKKVAPYTVELRPLKEQIGEDKNNTANRASEGEYYTYDPSSIPYMLINAMKEQQKVIEQLQSTLADLQSEVESLKSSINETDSKSLKAGSQKEIGWLGQNIPNPAHQTTSIQYTIPTDALSARLVITDQKGTIIRQFENFGAGTSQIEIPTSQLATGIYTYTLYINGEKADSKQMIIQ
jgi:hypothetical protein